MSYFNVVCWGDLGENAAATLTKGNRCIVAGRMEQRDYETNAGEKRTVFEVVADEIGPSLAGRPPRWSAPSVQVALGAEAPSQSPQAAPDPVYGDEEPF